MANVLLFCGVSVVTFPPAHIALSDSFLADIAVKWIVLACFPRCHELLKPRGRSQNRIVGAPAGRRGAGSSYSTVATIAQEMGVSQLYSGGEVFEQQFFRVTLVKVNGN